MVSEHFHGTPFFWFNRFKTLGRRGSRTFCFLHRIRKAYNSFFFRCCIKYMIWSRYEIVFSFCNCSITEIFLHYFIYDSVNLLFSCVFNSFCLFGSDLMCPLPINIEQNTNKTTIYFAQEVEVLTRLVCLSLC